MDQTDRLPAETPAGPPPFSLSPFAGAAYRALAKGVASGTVQHVYHYTDATGFMGIVGEGVFRLTDAQFLNDGSEVSYGLELCLQALEGTVEKLPKSQKDFARQVLEQIRVNRPRYRQAVFCTSLRDNLLNQWRDYGREVVSYSIGLDVARLVNLDEATFPIVAARMIYSPKKQVRVLRAVIAEVKSILQKKLKDGWVPIDQEDELAAQAAVEIARVLYWFKNPGFEAEDEVRIMQDIPTIVRNRLSPKFRGTRLGLVPYFEWKWNVAEGRLPISSVMIGPSPHGEIASEAAKVFLEQNGYPDVPVTYSTIPIRR